MIKYLCGRFKSQSFSGSIIQFVFNHLDQIRGAFKLVSSFFKMRLKVTLPDGRTKRMDPSTFLKRLDEEGWLIVHDVASRDLLRKL